MNKPIFRTIALILLLNSSILSFGQHQLIDSMVKELNKESSSTERINLMNVIANHSLYENDSIAGYYINKAIKLSIEENYDIGLSDAYQNLSRLLIQKGYYDSALRVNEINLKLREGTSPKSQLADTYYDIGQIEQLKGNYSKSLEYFLKTLKIRESDNDTLGISNCFNNIAIVHNYLNNSTKAIEYFNKSLQLRIALGDENEIANSYNNLGIMYRAIGQNDKALEYYFKSLETKERLEDTHGMSNSLNNIGITYFYDENYLKALEYYLKSLDLRKKDNDLGNLASSFLNIGEVYIKLSRLDEAENYLNLAKEHSLATGNKDDLMLTYLILSELYKKKQDYKNALYNYEMYSSINDSIYTEHQNETIAEMQTKYEVEKKEQEIALLQKEKEIAVIETKQNELIVNISIVGFVLISFFLIAIFRSYRKDIEKGKLLKQHQKDIESQNKSLIDLNYEKDELMKIVSHDMRSPLNQIDGLVTLINFEANRLSEQQKVSLSKITNTTAHSKELLSKILSSKTLDPSQLSLDLKVIGVNPIIQSLASDYTIIAREKNIDIELEMPAETLNVNIDKNYFEQVIENLISNAIKFSPTDKKVSVRLLKINSSIRVEIEDEGPGVNKNDMNKLFGKYQRLSAQPTGGETSTGLGLSIVKKYVQAMNGKVWCESEEGQGAKFIVEFNKA